MQKAGLKPTPPCQILLDFSSGEKGTGKGREYKPNGTKGTGRAGRRTMTLLQEMAEELVQLRNSPNVDLTHQKNP